VHDVHRGDLEKSSDSEFEPSRFDASELTGAVQVASTEKRILFVGIVSGPALGRWWGGGCWSARDNEKC
jgi:hypothetical protein